MKLVAHFMLSLFFFSLYALDNKVNGSFFAMLISCPSVRYTHTRVESSHTHAAHIISTAQL